MNEVDLIQKKLERQVKARKQAEAIMEQKALELFEANKELASINEKLEEKIILRTQELVRSELKYKSILDNMELGLLEVNTKGKITKAYPRFCKMIGYRKEELEGNDPLKQFVLPEYWTVLEQQEEKRVKGEAGTYRIQVKTKSGSLKWFLVSGAPFFNEKGMLIGTLGVHYDVTEQTNLKLELQKAKIIAERSQRAEQLFLANMSHEIRTPLNAIVGMSHLLKDTQLDQEQNDYLEILNSSANILQALIADILDISKIDAGKIEVQSKPFHLPQIIEDVKKIFQVRLDSKPVVIETIVDPQLTHLLLGDSLLLNQILLNLVGNAEKFTKEGSITLKVTKVSDISDSVKLKFEIIDTGIGIDKKKINLIFDEFKQASHEINEEFGGTGLGLAITKKLINLLGGKIEVKSEKGIGSVFSFELKFKKTDQLLSEKKNVFGSDLDYSKVDNSVLVVEDNIMNQKYILKLFEKWGLSAKLAVNGQEAVEMTQQEKFSIIFMDIQMPVMNGYVATRRIKNQDNLNKATPIIALTASTLISKKREALDSGMSDYLSKPFDPNQLAEMVSKYLKIEFKPQQESNEVVSLDRAYLEETYAGDKEYAIDIFETFLEITHSELENLTKAINAQDLNTLALVAHKIKPTFTMVGMPHVTESFQALEYAAKENNFKKSDDLYQVIMVDMDKNLEAISKELERLNNSN